jgi:hypothetical protein
VIIENTEERLKRRGRITLKEKKRKIKVNGGMGTTSEKRRNS